MLVETEYIIGTLNIEHWFSFPLVSASSSYCFFFHEQKQRSCVQLIIKQLKVLVTLFDVSHGRKHSYLEILDIRVLSLWAVYPLKLAALVGGRRTTRSNEGLRGRLFIQTCLQSDTSLPYTIEELQKHCCQLKVQVVYYKTQERLASKLHQGRSRVAVCSLIIAATISCDLTMSNIHGFNRYNSPDR